MTLSRQSDNLNIAGEINDILRQELECFQNLLDRTQEVFGNTDKDNLSLDSVSNLLKARKYWIELLQGLEEKRHAITIKQNPSEKLREEISQIGRTLVAIDAKILDILNMKKLRLIKEIANFSDNKTRNKNYYQENSMKSKVIDIIQE